jgi:hypothetical protein
LCVVRPLVVWMLCICILWMLCMYFILLCANLFLPVDSRSTLFLQRHLQLF